MPHLNVYHNLGMIKQALLHKHRSIYVHNTPEMRDVLGMLQRYGYIGRFLAVQEPFRPKHSRRILNRVSKPRKEVSPYLLVFLKYRLSNKHLPVMGGIYYRKRPNRYTIPYKTTQMKVWNQGVGMEFVRRDRKEWMPTHMAKLRGLNGYKGFKVWS
eukprot:555280_1